LRVKAEDVEPGGRRRKERGVELAIKRYRGGSSSDRGSLTKG
jgi:hypothetical protein